MRVPCQGKMLEAAGGHVLGEHMNGCLKLTVTQNMLPLKVVMPLSLETLYPRKRKFSGTPGAKAFLYQLESCTTGPLRSLPETPDYKVS